MHPTISHHGGSGTVFDTLAASPLAPQRRALLGDGLGLALWRRSTPGMEIDYARPGHHTLAYYVRAGTRTERAGSPAILRDGQLCSLPDQHESRWRVRGELAFLHVYFMPEHVSRRAVLEHDCEPRQLSLDDTGFFEHPELARRCLDLARSDWEGPDARLRANENVHEIISTLLRAQGGPTRTLAKPRGSLAVAARRRVADYIETHLAQDLSLATLAQVACLSEYHFLRMFRASFGMPPHAWIGMRRIDRARQLLRHTALPLQQVADACGYADLSHFSHRFRSLKGCAPSHYRKAWRGD